MNRNKKYFSSEKNMFNYLLWIQYTSIVYFWELTITYWLLTHTYGQSNQGSYPFGLNKFHTFSIHFPYYFDHFAYLFPEIISWQERDRTFVLIISIWQYLGAPWRLANYRCVRWMAKSGCPAQKPPHRP